MEEATGVQGTGGLDQFHSSLPSALSQKDKTIAEDKWNMIQLPEGGLRNCWLNDWLVLTEGI